MNCKKSKKIYDDIGGASTSQHVLDNIETTTTEKLKQGNLHINQSKPERYHIKKGCDESWKKCKYVDSILGKTEDIKRHKRLTNTAFYKVKPIFTNKQVGVDIKIRIFNALLTSIF